MIVVDSSVVVAILRRESDAPTWIDVIDRTSKAFMSIVSFVETSMVIYGRRFDAAPGDIALLLGSLGIDIVPITLEQGESAVTAFLRFGKRHRAALNLADCFSYALAKVHNAPLLFQGNDFSKTDLLSALQP
jgi:ribonuclease VapC